ncbi:hypothetical protein L226DRAFT_147819 [Lentinus tigrinus ALCF2SS1-7]|uniref:Uncharacterized protein n=1 Tax=Lentinus tigrinus ALCF2SS1-6 TaxID=1328759 RepID=A0A5C2S4S8_9APHY|nr:hypothetical protein L227DRAFT_612658 [Lentinus tigrinus ALCF2SS1-6]RPD72822.1 hypothetical protein L226DRAFT_147819 [Lentinus tigrinus ALCF2SS1-7]
MSSGADSIVLDDNGLRVQRDLLNSRVVALFVESMLFGVFAVTYALGVGELLCRNQPGSMSKRNRRLLGVNTLMFALATAHLALTIKTTLNGFVTNGADKESVYDAFFESSHFGTATDVAQFYIYVTQTLIGDAFMVYRLFVVWGGKRAVVALPIILIVIDAVGGYGAYPIGGLGDIILPLVFFSFSFFTNMLSTVLIMARLLRSDKLVHAHWQWHSRAWFNFVRYRRVVEAIVQSAAIYSTASIALVVTSFLSPNIGYVACLSIFPQLIGIVFGLIVIHIARKSALPIPSDEWQDSRATAPHAVARDSVRLPEIRISGSTAVEEAEKYDRVSSSSDPEAGRP